MAHDGSGGLAASNRPESETLERGSPPCEQVGRTAGSCSVDRIGFERPRIRTLRDFQRLDDQICHHASSAIPAPDIETREGPNRHIIDRLENWLAIEPAQILTRRELTPAHRPLPIESQQPWWWTLLHDPAERALVFVARPLVIFRADSPVHAPATVAGSALAKEGFKGGPERGVSGRIVRFMRSPSVAMIIIPGTQDRRSPTHVTDPPALAVYGLESPPPSNSVNQLWTAEPISLG